MRPRLLDLFCGAGGAGVGYERAGFDVIGVDIKPQPRYPFPSIQADALDVLRDLVNGRSQMFPTKEAPALPVAWWTVADFDAIHASPPCQGYLNEHFRVTPSGHVRKDHPRLIAEVRELLIATGLPYVIENVPSARKHLDHPVQLCGSSFGLAVRRHRLFESNVPIMAVPCAHHLQSVAKFPTQFRPKNGQNPLAKVVQVYGHGKGASAWPAAMGIDWMRREELAEAIPPAYTEHIGSYLLAEVVRRQERAA